MVVALICSFFMWQAAGGKDWYVLLIAVIVLILFPLNIILHEAGHIIAGQIMDMQFVSVRIGHMLVWREEGKLKFKVSPAQSVAGASTFFPKSPENMRQRMLIVTLGGAICNFIYALLLFILYFALSHHSLLTFFAMFAPLSLCEGIVALIPVVLPAGKTDGAVAYGLIEKNADERVMLAVLAAQGILNTKTFDEVPEKLLFRAPMVREDLPARHAQLLLQVQYLLHTQKEEEAKKVLDRLGSLYDYLSEEAIEEAEHYRTYFAGSFQPRNTPLYGVNELETELAQRLKK